MLGDLLGETTGRKIARSVLSTEPPKVEVSLEDSGKMLAVHPKNLNTNIA
jgi:hypothetical protein